ncbi:Ribosomal small subunit pseudouridine synthase A, partial [Durusdinium trenchii]
MVYHARTLSSPLSAFPPVMRPQAFTQVMHEYGFMGRDVDEKLCLHSKAKAKKLYLSPFRQEETTKWVIDRVPLPEPRGAPRVGLASDAKEIVARARRLIINAKAQLSASWDQIFISHAEELSFQELKKVLRRDLAISPKALSDFDLKVLFLELDADKSGTVNVKEMLDYVAHGPKRIHDEQAMLMKRTARVRRNLNMACRKFAGVKAFTVEGAAKIFKQL